MTDWNAYRDNLKQNVKVLAKLSPNTLDGLQTLEKVAPEHKHLDAKTRELISLAVAVTTRCDGCIAVHTVAAKKAGASKEEIAEALGVAVALNAGAALVYSSRALEAFDSVKE
ncbi:carboxymuconolactone decarboxylase family protein [Acetobacter indonesiensis]|uniref:Alkyl hydroperoxide reductase AhpD n=1 Tax=Acetobacter indonesiensis TaxID=104101 RepID=A0A252AXQ4_9PROT|nr:carboxymuconolactone decarboxylase family protein [Acetobacter indonesiensis]OUI96010.1 alkylhydroperoxidase [Acetobacter indonesiensis]GAN62767.1 alkylhydroperoxidase AhpD [Acetobacter indonesiensis]GBQ54629.1 alkylhydroperoxidase [Acetobacter indonesiensis NRIC 0313]GEN02336.1 alkyl hydroperoxide reductase AhpD [Acetobacter indonesiensis]